MSLLMDALRKAEEAKRKAAQDAKSEEADSPAVPEEEQASVVAEKATDDSSGGEIELSMAEMEDVPARSAVPNLNTTIEFEDEEDYVLPSSVGAPAETELDAEETARGAEPAQAESSTIEFEPQSETKTAEAAEDDTAAQQDESVAVEGVAAPIEPMAADPVPSENLGLDALESEGEQKDEPSEREAPLAEVEAEKPAAPVSRIPAASTPKTRGGASFGRSKEADAPKRRTAQNVFAAKKSPALSKRNIQIAIGGGVFLLLLVFGSYFYISLNQESTFNIPDGSYVATQFVDDGALEDVEETSQDDGAAQDQELADTATPSGNLDLTDAPALEEILAESEFPEIAETEPAATAADLEPEILADPPSPLETVATTIGDEPIAPAPAANPSVAADTEVASEPVPSAVEEPQQAAANTEPTNLISFSRQATDPTIDPNLDGAYNAYQRGSLDEAEVLYRRALASDPMQRDALLGLATIVARNGDSAEALDLYSRLLARNPRDPIARAGLMDILPAGSPASQEADLKRLLSDYPNVAALSYAYGNFLASSQRWSEAQQAYFRALQLAKADAAVSGLVNPDYAFNLAVSLEHLNQSQPAQNYYREALEFAANHPAGFDVVALRSRLASMAGSDSDA